MRKHFASLLVAVLVATGAIVLAAPTGLAQAPATDGTRAALEKDLIESQRLDQLRDYWRISLREPGDALAQMRGQSRTVDPDASWRKAVDKVFADPRITADLARRQADGLSQTEARDIIAFRRTPLGRKVTEAEVTSPWPPEKTGDQAFVMGEIAKAARAMEKDKARARVLGDILQAAGGGAVQAELLMAMTRGFAVGMALATPSGQGRPSTEDIDANLERERPKFMSMMRTLAVPSMAIAYRSLSQAELEAYLRHLRTPAGRKNIAAVVKAVATGLSEASSEIGKTFAEDINAQRL